jgi:hypothetical protein
MKTVSLPEANLLTLTQAALELGEPQDLRRLLLLSARAPERLGPTAMRLFQESLAKGTVLALARAGGWRAEVGGRLWERGALPELRFGPALFRFLQWVLRTPLAEGGPGRIEGQGPFFPAEEVVVAALVERVRGSGCETAVLRHPGVRASPLLALLYAGELGAQERLEFAPPFSATAHGPLLEGVQSWAVQAWLGVEKAKGSLEAPEVLLRVGDAQRLVLESFLQSASAARHLAMFLVEVGRRWLAPGRTAAHYGAALDSEAPLGTRVAARRSSLALLRALGRLRAWDQEHRATRFFDEGYAAAQALIRAWERLGEVGFAEAARVVTEVEQWPV